MPVIYDSNSIIPAPLITISKDAEHTRDGTKGRVVYQIKARGTLVAYKGSPNSQGTFWPSGGYPPDENIAMDARLASMRAKQGALCRLFCDEGKWFEIQPLDGSIPTKFQPRFNNVEFQEGIWTDRCDYTVTMDADTIWFGSVACCSASGNATLADDTWAIEQADDQGRTYRLTHAVSAEGRKTFLANGAVNQEGWQVARDRVLQSIGFESDKVFASGVLNLVGYSPYNFSRSQTIDEPQGKFAVQESWVCYNPTVITPDSYGSGVPALEDFSCSARTSAQDGKTQVNIEGSINGFYERAADYSLTTTKWTNALAKWDAVKNNLLARAQAITGITLNSAPLDTSVVYNRTAGAINYQYSYDNRCAFSVAGVKSENIQVTDSNPADVFAAIGVLGRTAGPVLQDIGTKTQSVRSVQVEVILDAANYASCQVASPGATIVSAVYDLIQTYRPSATQIFVEKDEPSWQPKSGRYSRTVVWVYQ